MLGSLISAMVDKAVFSQPEVKSSVSVSTNKISAMGKLDFYILLFRSEIIFFLLVKFYNHYAVIVLQVTDLISVNISQRR